MTYITTAGGTGTIALAICSAIFFIIIAVVLRNTIRAVGVAGFAARVAACMLIAASATLGTDYAWHIGIQFGWMSAVAFAAMALAGEILKPLAIETAFRSAWRRPVFASVALVFGLTVVAYSFVTEIGVSSTGRSDLAAQRAAATKSAKLVDGKRERAEAELAQLNADHPKDRAASIMEPIVSRARTYCRIEVTTGSRQTICAKPRKMVDELARAKRRVELEAVLAVAPAGKAPPAMVEREADPQATAVAVYLTAAGWPVDVGTVARWIALLPVLVLELGSAFGWLIATRIGGTFAGTHAATATVAGTFAGRRARLATFATFAGKHRADPLPENVTFVGKGPEAVLPANVVSMAGKRPTAAAKAAPVPANDAGPLAIVDALRRAGKPLCVSDLGAAMGVCPGEASKRWREAGGQVRARRAGRKVLIELAS